MGSRRQQGRGRSKHDIKGRTAKAFHLTLVGELSSTRHVLESSPVAPGDKVTKRILTDKARGRLFGDDGRTSESWVGESSSLWAHG